ncbi:MAG TPA: MFS transporter [Candidatus Saccharimonadales bacterium]|nr:MFS transporter [Candidatus Saccharimonadales bacterium]
MIDEASSGTNFPGRTWLRFFKPPPPARILVTDPAEIRVQFKQYQRGILLSTIIGYACFYLVRKNIGFALPGLHKEFGITKSAFGMFLTLHGLTYGVSKFANGFLADRCNARVFMVFALVCCCAANVLFGVNSVVVVLGLLWIANGWFQGMGFPPCARLLTHWFSPKELATKMSVWNTSHSIGAAVAAVMCGYLAVWSWRLCFFVPAVLAMGGAIYMWFMLRDTPESVGLPEPPGSEQGDLGASQSTAEFKAFVKKQVFQNPYIWLFGFANFFVYIIRYAILDWGPVLLGEAKGIKLTHAGWMIAFFEVSGVLGMLLGGWITDKVFAGRCARTCLFCMLLAGLSIFAFWKIPGRHSLLSTAALGCGGFFIYAPQALVGIASANLATKRAAATAVGVTGLFGYLSTIFSGWGLGKLVEVAGWRAGFVSLLVAAFLGAVLFAAAWNAKASGYSEQEPSEDAGKEALARARSKT